MMQAAAAAAGTRPHVRTPSLPGKWPLLGAACVLVIALMLFPIVFTFLSSIKTPV